MTLAYFCLSGLALLPASAVSTTEAAKGQSALEVMITEKQRVGYIDWVYSLQSSQGGFRGSDSIVLEEQGNGSSSKLPLPLNPAHIIQTYTALLILGLLNDDFKRLDRPRLITFMRKCQNDDGSFTQFPGCPEPGDPRSTYSAFVISSILNDWSAIEVDRALGYLRSCQRPDGGFATSPGLEAHGGYTYLTVASFVLSSHFDHIPRSQDILRWLVGRQLAPVPPVPPPIAESEDEDEADEQEEGKESSEEECVPRKGGARAGFSGRVNKFADACYSFWCTGALHLLRPGEVPLLNSLDRSWLHSCQHQTFGGFARDPDSLPDVYHTYLSLATLSMGDQPGLGELDVAWNVSKEVADRIRKSIDAL